jgi:very-short-patch-repair endonuclease
MGRITAAITPLGGVARTSELLERGIGPGLIRLATRSGELIRVRKGWYAAPSADRQVLRAVRVGGSLGCLSAARHHGLWVPEDPPKLHVAIPPTSSRLRSPDEARARLDVDAADVVLHWMSGSRVVQTVREAIDLGSRCGGADTGFVLLESALHRRLLSTRDHRVLLRAGSREFVALAKKAAASSASGTESLVKLMLVRLGVPFRQQVTVPGVGRVDFLVGESLVIEVDSAEFHADAYRDRRRDAIASIRGMRSLRFTYGQVMYESDVVSDAIAAAIIRGDHRG